MLAGVETVPTGKCVCSCVCVGGGAVVSFASCLHAHTHVRLTFVINFNLIGKLT